MTLRIVQAAPHVPIDVDVSKVYATYISDEYVPIYQNGVFLANPPAFYVLFYDGSSMRLVLNHEDFEKYSRALDKGNKIDRGRLPRSCIKSFKLNGYWPIINVYSLDELKNIANEYAADPNVRDVFHAGVYLIDRYKIASMHGTKIYFDGELKHTLTNIQFENGHEIGAPGDYVSAIRRIFENQIVAFVGVLAADGDHAIAARVASFLLR